MQNQLQLTNNNDQTIILDCNTAMKLDSQLTLSMADIGILETAITELYISRLFPNLCRKLTRKMCLKINSWHGAINNLAGEADLTISSIEMNYILSSIKVYIKTIPHVFLEDRMNAYVMLNRFNRLEHSNSLAA